MRNNLDRNALRNFGGGKRKKEGKEGEVKLYKATFFLFLSVFDRHG